MVSPGDRRGDKVKFESIALADEWFFTVDDDIIYPPTYVEDTLRWLRKWPGRVATYHGWTMNRRGKRKTTYRFFEDVDEAQRVHVAGTGVSAFHVNTIRPQLYDFPTLNADIWFAILAAKKGIPLVVLPHSADYFGYIEPERSVFGETDKQTGSSLDGSEMLRYGSQILASIHYDRDEGRRW